LPASSSFVLARALTGATGCGRSSLTPGRATAPNTATAKKASTTLGPGDLQVTGTDQLAAANPAERDAPFDKAAALYHHFAVPHERGIGRSKIHKVLHLKRPCLYPVLDRNLVHLYKARARDWIDVILGAAAGDSITYWAAIRADLIDQRNSAELAACRTALLSSSATAAMATLPAVRLLDILAWDVANKR
jgi:hypothetical protein